MPKAHILDRSKSDLFSSRYQKKAPFQTHGLTPHCPKRMTMIFPEKLEYTSEGRRETLYFKRREIDIKVYTAITNFQFRKTSVFSIVVQPSDSFSELDLIKLSSLFGSKQEDSTLLGSIRFSFEGKLLGLSALVEYLFSPIVAIKTDWRNVTSSLQISSKTIDGIEWPGYLKLIHESFGNDGQAVSNFKTTYEKNEASEYFSNMMCGMILGIFDFERMGFEEVLDTIKPIKSTETSALIMNRSNLLFFSSEDSVFNAVRDTIGISPYLIIPNIVLAFDESLLSNGYQILVHAIQGPRLKTASAVRILRDIEKELTFELPHVFQYETEKSILQFGYEERNLNEIRREIESLKIDLDKRIDRGYNMRRNYFELIITFLLIVVSFLQLEPFIRSICKFLLQDHKLTKVDRVEGMFYLICFLALGLGLFFFGRKVYKNSR